MERFLMSIRIRYQVKDSKGEVIREFATPFLCQRFIEAMEIVAKDYQERESARLLKWEGVTYTRF
jgi:hypothetical protein